MSELPVITGDPPIGAFIDFFRGRKLADGRPCSALLQDPVPQQGLVENSGESPKSCYPIRVETSGPWNSGTLAVLFSVPRHRPDIEGPGHERAIKWTS